MNRCVQRSRRKGYVLPFVIIVVTVTGMLALSFTGTGLRAVRAARLAWNADRSLLAAEEGLALALANWRNDSLWLDSLGTASAPTRITAAGESVSIRLWRTQPLVMWMAAQHEGGTGAVDTARRDVSRVFRLTPPPLPILAPLASADTVRADHGTLLSGADLPLPDSPCGIVRDTAGVAPLIAAAVQGDASPWTTQPMAAPPPSSLSQEVAHFWSLATPLTESLEAPALPIAWPVRRPWHAITLVGATVVTGPTQYTGMVLVDGPLEVRGHVQIQGVVVIRGAFDARLATLHMRGAIIALGPVRLGAQSQIFYDRCAVESALAAVSTPSIAPFHAWGRQSP